VREKYPSTSKFARRGVSDFNGRPAVAAQATAAAPGTAEKVAVLEERARLGLSLWHPLDVHADPASKGFLSAGRKVRLGKSMGCFVQLPKEQVQKMTETIGGTRGEERMPKERG
jgi:hypothetical protein